MHLPPALLAVGLTVFLLVAKTGSGHEASDDDSLYLTQVKPLLSRCYACHGALKQEADLRLDTVRSLVQGGNSGTAIVPGDPEQSLLVRRVAAADLSERMPPEHEGEAFSTEQVEVLKQWIAAGAVGPVAEEPEPDPSQHWAFQPITRPPVPVVANQAWVRNPIDAFVAQKHADLGLKPAESAAPSILLRRLHVDLIGLPPDPKTAWQLQHVSPNEWYAATVDQLLADPRHGQRWARHWMDIWRYSDWWGLGEELRNSQKHLFHWRDWLVENLNQDRSYAEMLRLMLAADELTPLDQADLRATGYLARNYYLFNRHPWMEETVEHFGKAMLGLTTNCAKCHDHKYDPITQTDYYRLRAFFEPYHVRNDMVPGEPNLSVNAIPRAFDGWLDAPTHRLIRGDEKQPDKSLALAPGLPDFLTWAELEIQPVALPAAAFHVDRQPWVMQNHLEAAQQVLTQTDTELAKAEQAAVEAQKHLSTMVSASPDMGVPQGDSETDLPSADAATTLIDDNFAELNPERWQVLGGQWQHEPNALRQNQDGPQHSVLRWRGDAPADFDVTMRVKIRGGSQWRSVGISFDESQVDPLSEASSNDSAHSVYISAYAGGPKVQASYRQGSQWQYPGEAAISQPIELERSYELRIQVRGTLVNVFLDQELVLVWRSPLARRTGFLQFTTFDALATLEHVRLTTLPTHVALREAPNISPDRNTVAGAKWLADRADLEWRIAQAKQRWAAAQVESVRQRGLAAQQMDSATEETRQRLTQAAGKAERFAELEAARLAILELELRQRSTNSQSAEIKQQQQQALERVQAAEQGLNEPATSFTPLVGSQWSATRFLFSGKDDPTVTFPATSTGRRTALANWLVDARNPLTARVAINHLWNRHFGQPLVPSVFDFGRNGSPPTHPELLDWLACELIESGWSMKHIHRLIVQSATYQMSSQASNEWTQHNHSLDPDNQFYWRRPVGRMESQVVRDSLLDLAGQLDASPGGPPIPADQQANSRRRSLYFFHSNNDRNVFLTSFDEASVMECYRREQSVVPQQALALANSDLTNQLLSPIASRIVTLSQEIEDGSLDVELLEDGDLIQRAFVVVLGRACSMDELKSCREAMTQWRELDADSTDQKSVTQNATANLVWVLLNHNDFVSIR
ncbi:MAG: DUF1553 domain-containing protein [Planctomycetaceae bacterium]|nr:DUF1553 domain-containing protein [Planctomycetaceae bacterium]